MKNDVSCSEIKRAGIKLEGLHSVIPINVNGSDIMLSRIFQVLLLLALLRIEILNDLRYSTRLTKTESCYFPLTSCYLFFVCFTEHLKVPGTHFPLTQAEKTSMYFIMQDIRLGSLYTLGVTKLLHYTIVDCLKFLKCSQQITHAEIFCSKKSWIWSPEISLWKWRPSWAGRISSALLSLIFYQHTQQQQLVCHSAYFKVYGK